MAECSEISPMLGPFEDGELEPHEMQEVARHLAHCPACEKMLADFDVIGNQLRSGIVAPASLDGFAASVMARIEELPVPVTVRIKRAVRSVGDYLSSGFPMATVAMAAAVITIAVVTPLLRHRIVNGPLDSSIAKIENAPAHELAKAGGDISTAKHDAETTAADLADADNELSTDSHAVISRLESEIPSVAVWSEPRANTTVIWLPEQ